jgi:hypothetical protein
MMLGGYCRLLSPVHFRQGLPMNGIWRQLKLSLLIGLLRIVFSTVLAVKKLTQYCSQASFCRISE